MAYLQRNASSAGDRKKSTMSVWIKPNIQSSSVTMISCWSADNVAGHFVWRIKSDGTIGWSRWSDDSYSTRKLLDENAWYHCVIAVDTTQATASDRIKLYVNNEQITSFSVGPNYPAQNTDLPICGANAHTIGLNNYSSSGSQFKGYMSHFHLVDGTTLTPSAFGSTDATTGEWQINTSPSVTYGTNGFFMFKDDNSANDDSGQGNNFTLNGTLPKSEDNPSNVFATWNPLWSASNGNVGDVTFSNGNTTTTTSSSYRTTPTTLGMKSGKYYWEIKRNSTSSGDTHFGVMSENATPANTATWIGNAANGWVLAGDAGQPYTGGSSGGVLSNGTVGSGAIFMGAYDGATGKLYFGVNGTWAGTANPSTGANAHYTLDTSLIYFPCVSTGSDVSANFGNGYFGTTAVSSAGTNASGIGIFEYDVPTGYTALCTKGLNE